MQKCLKAIFIAIGVVTFICSVWLALALLIKKFTLEFSYDDQDDDPFIDEDEVVEPIICIEINADNAEPHGI